MLHFSEVALLNAFFPCLRSSIFGFFFIVLLLLLSFRFVLNFHHFFSSSSSSYTLFFFSQFWQDKHNQEYMYIFLVIQSLYYKVHLCASHVCGMYFHLVYLVFHCCYWCCCHWHFHMPIACKSLLLLSGVTPIRELYLVLRAQKWCSDKQFGRCVLREKERGRDFANNVPVGHA